VDKRIVSSAGKRKFPYHPESAQEIRFFGKIGFLNRAQGAQDFKIWKNRISQTVPKRAQKLKKKSAAQPRNPIFWKNRISQTVCPNVPKN
jgi:hypothetical protein